jgi:hypothetical protein
MSMTRYNSPGRVPVESSRGLANLVDTDGLATLNSDGNVVEPTRAITGTALAADQDVRIDSDELTFRDSSTTFTVEKTSRKDAASGYAGLDSNSDVIKPARKITSAAKLANQDVQITGGAFTYQSGGVAYTVLAEAVAGNIRRNITVDLLAVDINGMNATPFQLIAAPGANAMILVESLVFEMTRTATAFANGGTVSVEYATGGDDVIATIASTVITGAAGTTLTTRVLANLSDIAVANISNKALVITNDTAAFDTGTGTAKVHIGYRVITLTA